MLKLEKKNRAIISHAASPAFGNATGISPPHLHPHLPTKMNIDNSNNNIVIGRIKNSNNTTTQACAACKYQRRKCEPNCILSPYFPHTRQAQFLNAHKLFGVSNITKIIRNLSPADKDQAMKTIIFQSDVRASDPVGGCYRIIKELQYMIEYYQAELDLVMHQLTVCRSQHAQAQAQAQAEAQVQVQTTEDHDEDDQQQRQYLPFMTLDQAAPNNNSSDPNSDVINADPLVAYSPSSLQYTYHQQQQQLNLELGGIVNNHGEEDRFIVVNDHCNRYKSNVQDNGDAWVQREEEQPHERMVNYCLNQIEEDLYDSKDGIGHKKDTSLFQTNQKLKFDDIEDDRDRESSHQGPVLNDCKNLCRVEKKNGLVHEEGPDVWFALANCKRRKTM